MAFDTLTLNSGTGGAAAATDSFTDTDTTVRVMPYGAVAFGSLNGPYTPVDATHGFPVQQQTSAVWDYNLKQYGGSAVGATNALHVQPGTGAVFAASQSGTWNVATVTTLTGITNVVHVDDNSGSLTVDGTVTANAGTNLNTSALALESGGNLAALAAAVRAEDSASADADKGVGLLAIRKASPANTSGTDGDYEFLQMSAGRLWASATIDAALPAGTNVIGHVVTDSGSVVSAAQSGTWNVGTVTTLTGITNVVHVDDNAGSLTVDNGGTFAVQATVAAGATNIAKAEDVASADADVGVPAMAVRKATPANTSGTDGDYEMLQMSAGRLWVDASGKTLTVDGSGVTQPVSGTVSITANSAVNVAQVAGTAADTNSGNKSAGTLRVVLATDQPALTNKLLVTPDANSAVNVSQMNGVTVTMGNGASGTGVQRVTVASDSTGVLGATQSGTWTVQPGNTANTTPWLVTDTPAASGGLSFAAVVASAASNNKTQVKGSAGQLYFVSAQNLNASPRYLKVFNNTSAGVTMGTTSADYQFLIPGNTAGAGVVLNIDKGIAMGTGITIAITGAIGATDNTSISASEVTVLVGYK